MMGEEFFTPFEKEELIPQEETIEVIGKKEKLSIGLPKETQFQEKRVCLTPDAVSILTANGHSILVESEAGEGASFLDHQYAEAGAYLSYNKKEVFSQPVVLKVAPPSIKEIELISHGACLISSLQLNAQHKDYFLQLMRKKVIAVSFGEITDETGGYPILKTLSEIAGTSSILIASELMSTTHQGTGLIMGGVTGVHPTEVVILGAGTVGKYAAQAALGLGASVRIFDSSVSKLRDLQHHVGQRVFTSIIDSKTLTKALKRCDVLIGAVKGKGHTPIIVTESMVEMMKKGAVIIDVSIDLGGCVETSEITTHLYPAFEKHGVIHYGVTNISSRVSRTASRALSNFFLQSLLEIAKHKDFNAFVRKEKGFRNGVYIYKGIMTKKIISDWFEIPFRDINLLIV